MPRYIIEGDKAEIGVLVIDWDSRTFEVHGVAGDDANSLSVAAAADIEAMAREGLGTYPFLVWPSNADDLPQLAFRDTVDDISAEIDDEADRLGPRVLR